MSKIVRPSIDLDAKRTELRTKIDQMFVDFQKEEQHINIQKQRVTRKVLLVGPSKSGKTTLKRVLGDPRYMSEELSLRSLSDTVPTCQLNIESASPPVTLDIVELPERMIRARSNLSVINEECVRLRIQDFHMICLCISFDTGIDGSAIRSFDCLIQHLGYEQLSRNLCLIITRCESKNDEQRQKLRSEIMQDVEYTKVTQYLGRGIHFSGALNHDSWNGASEALYNQFETVYDYRRNLLQLIAEDIKPFHIQSPLSQPDSNLPHLIPRYFPKNTSHNEKVRRFFRFICTSKEMLSLCTRESCLHVIHKDISSRLF
jgi:hypothetical protein